MYSIMFYCWFWEIILEAGNIFLSPSEQFVKLCYGKNKLYLMKCDESYFVLDRNAEIQFCRKTCHPTRTHYDDSELSVRCNLFSFLWTQVVRPKFCWIFFPKPRHFSLQQTFICVKRCLNIITEMILNLKRLDDSIIPEKWALFFD